MVAPKGVRRAEIDVNAKLNYTAIVQAEGTDFVLCYQKRYCNVNETQRALILG